jgi:hypothetical protein
VGKGENAVNQALFASKFLEREALIAMNSPHTNKKVQN